MKLLRGINKLFSIVKHVHVDIDSMTLISREEFKTPLGTGIREIYKDGSRTVEITCKPTEESVALERKKLQS